MYTAYAPYAYARAATATPTPAVRTRWCPSRRAGGGTIVRLLVAEAAVRPRVGLRVKGQVVVACNDDLARVRLRLQPGTEGLYLLRPAGVGEIARVDQAVARGQWLSRRRAVRVTHAHEPHRSGRLPARLLQWAERQRPRLLPDAEHLPRARRLELAEVGRPTLLLARHPAASRELPVVELRPDGPGRRMQCRPRWDNS
eukprot:scaffold7615_cov66-Phaeocystis_antarctica.AAC.1